MARERAKGRADRVRADAADAAGAGSNRSMRPAPGAGEAVRSDGPDAAVPRGGFARGERIVVATANSTRTPPPVGRTNNPREAAGGDVSRSGAVRRVLSARFRRSRCSGCSRRRARRRPWVRAGNAPLDRRVGSNVAMAPSVAGGRSGVRGPRERARAGCAGGTSVRIARRVRVAHGRAACARRDGAAAGDEAPVRFGTAKSGRWLMGSSGRKRPRGSSRCGTTVSWPLVRTVQAAFWPKEKRRRDRGGGRREARTDFPAALRERIRRR